MKCLTCTKDVDFFGTRHMKGYCSEKCWTKDGAKQLNEIIALLIDRADSVFLQVGTDQEVEERFAELLATLDLMDEPEPEIDYNWIIDPEKEPDETI